MSAAFASGKSSVRIACRRFAIDQSDRLAGGTALVDAEAAPCADAVTSMKIELR
jgi:hypothetical protein